MSIEETYWRLATPSGSQQSPTEPWLKGKMAPRWENALSLCVNALTAWHRLWILLSCGRDYVVR